MRFAGFVGGKLHEHEVPYLDVTILGVGIFGAAGLENSLFSCLLALALLLSVQEVEDEGFPHSVWVWLLIAVTRPEGIAYAALAGLWAMLASLQRGRGTKPTIQWLVAFFAPFIVYHAARYAYFAYPFPMTAYAKVTQSPSQILRWDGRGWRYLRKFGSFTWQGWLLPIYVVGLVGVSGWRVKAAAIAAPLALVCIFTGVETELFTGWNLARGTLLFAMAGVLAAPRVDTTVSYLRSLVASLALFSCFFAVFSMGDWMEGYRWLSMAAITLALLFAIGIDELARWISARSHAYGYWAIVAGGLAVLGAGQVQHSRAFAETLEISPYMVRKRVTMTNSLAERVFLDERGSVFTVDMGGYMWWSEMELQDRVGLTDVAVAMHRTKHYGRFIDEYIYVERRPHFIQLGDHIDVMKKHRKDFDLQYVYVNPMTHIRRDLLFDEEWPYGDEKRLTFVGGVQLSGWETPSLPAAQNETLYLEIGLRKRGPTFKVNVLLYDEAGQAVARWPLELGYGFHAPKDWVDDSVFHGRYPLGLPEDLPQGTYRLGIRVVAIDGVLDPIDDDSLPEGAEIHESGTVIFADPIDIGSAGQADQAATAETDAAVALAAETRCAEAARSWFVARQHRKDNALLQARGAELDTAIAECWMASALSDPDRLVADLETARRLDPSNRKIHAAARGAAKALYGKGLTARSNASWGRAFRSFSDAVRLEPHRPWARKYAEEARSHRLDAETKPKTKPKKGKSKSRED